MRALLLSLALLLALLRPAAAAPWAPLPPDACGALAVPCAQVDDFNLTARVAGTGFWRGTGPYGEGAGAQLAATLSLYKTVELSLAWPVAGVREPGPPAWWYGPPELRLRWRIAPRMGPGPFGGRWPEGEPYPKAQLAVYDVRPARATAAVGFRFLRPGSGLQEVGLLGSVDLRAWRLLFTASAEAVAAGDASRLQLGGRIAADTAGHFSAFSELLVHLPLAPAAERGGLRVHEEHAVALLEAVVGQAGRHRRLAAAPFLVGGAPAPLLPQLAHGRLLSLVHAPPAEGLCEARARPIPALGAVAVHVRVLRAKAAARS